jgi:hypothetical protein
MNCWYGIQHDVNIFCGCLCKIGARNQSGCFIDDKVLHKLSSKMSPAPFANKIVLAYQQHSSFIRNSHHAPQQHPLCVQRLTASFETYVTNDIIYADHNKWRKHN